MIKSYRKAAVVALTALFAAGCAEKEFNREDLRFHIEVETAGANEVTATVRHNGTEDVTYYAFCYRDFNYGETLAVERAVETLKTQDTDVASHLQRGSDAQVTCTGLQSSTAYRIVVVGLDSDLNIYGTPASAYFDTVEGAVIYEQNSDWIVVYNGKQVASDNSGYGDVVQVSSYTDANGFFAFVVPSAEYEVKGVQTCIEEAVAEREAEFKEMEDEGYLVDRSQYVYYTTIAYLLDMEPGVEYVAVAAGVDTDFKPTGLYSVSREFTPDRITYSQRYARWLGEWRISGTYHDDDGVEQSVRYNITIDYLVPDESYKISGYQQYEGVSIPHVQTAYEPTTGNMIFTSSYVGYFSGYDFYFYATKVGESGLQYLETYAGTTIATASLNADANQATVVVNSALTERGGALFNATQMQFIGVFFGSPYVFSPVPEFPFDMIKVSSSTTADAIVK